MCESRDTSSDCTPSWRKLGQVVIRQESSSTNVTKLPKLRVLSIGGDIQSIAQNSTLMINERLPEAELCRV